MNDSEQKEDVNAEELKAQWFIDLDWHRQNNRSFLLLVHSRLCPECQERVKKSGEVPVDDLLSAMKECCASSPDFITAKLPILESIFRIFLTNGNQPLSLEELAKQLSERRGGDTYHTSSWILSRLLANDSYYGLRRVPEQGEKKPNT